MLFKCDLEIECQYFRGEYSYLLSSYDNFDMDLPFNAKRAYGGTMIMWKTELDIFIKPLSTPSSCMLPILFTPEGLSPSAHIAIYLPTAGRDADFANELANLDSLITDILDQYPGIALFIRGDANVNLKNKKRVELFEKFCHFLDLDRIQLGHQTYHHFTGGGRSDSELDVILHSKGESETVSKIVCKLSDPIVLSHHDIILSNFLLQKIMTVPHQHTALAPRVENTRVKIRWSDDGINAYTASTSKYLGDIRSRWLDERAGQESSFSVLLQSTYSFLDKCARRTNNFIDLANPPVMKSSRKPLYLVKSERYMRTCFNALKRTPPSQISARLTAKLKFLKQQHSRLVRHSRNVNAAQRDSLLDGLSAGSYSSSKVYASLKRLNRTNNCKLQSINVGNKTYFNENVPDGIYDSIKDLKTEPIHDSNIKDFPDFSEECRHILDICSSRKSIPLITYQEAYKILSSLKKSVNDFYSITPLHFLYAGPDGIEHFRLLINTVISNINLAGVPELNTIYACVLHKGHGKDKNNANSYRTISTCPLIAK